MAEPSEPQAPEQVEGSGAEQGETKEPDGLPLPVEENDANAQPG